MGVHYLSLLDKEVDTYEQFAKNTEEAFDNEQSKTRAFRKAKGMFNKAIESGDSEAVAHSHLFLARIARLEGDEEASKEHYAKAAELGEEENDSSSSSMFKRMFESMPFFNRKR